jgi:hypothetical protein
LAKKRSFFAKLLTNRAFSPVRRARRGVILNEKGVLHPFFKLFPRTLPLLLRFSNSFGSPRTPQTRVRVEPFQPKNQN